LPTFAQPLLVWQDVLGLRVRRRGANVELSWHAPAGARQILIERWTGTRADYPARAALVPATAPNRLVAEAPTDSDSICYRVFCVYDGPAGDFLTPGSIITLVPGEEPLIETAAAESAAQSTDIPPVTETATAAKNTASGEPEFTEVIGQAPVAGPTDRPPGKNPLKRMGLWPPVPKTG
jgi:hypothetical protein